MSEATPSPENAPAEKPALLLAEFDSAAALVAAARSVREAGYSRFDAHSPFPIHGIDAAMGLRSALLPWLVFFAGVVGLVVALGVQLWMNAVDYPLNISGKPLFSLPANVPITYELIVLLAGGTAFLGIFLFGRLPELAHPLFVSDRFRRVTDDGFFLSIEAADERFDEKATSALLRRLGAREVETVFEPAAGRAIPVAFFWVGILAAVLALLPPLWIARVRATRSHNPRVQLIFDMHLQPTYRPQGASPLFADGRAARPPIPGTVARGQLYEDDHYYRGLADGGFAERFPREVTMETMRRGEERFRIYCSACHGLDGQGEGMTLVRAQARGEWIPLLPLSAEPIAAQPVGELFNTITHGIRTMPAYGNQIPVEDRWAIVAHLRALQYSRRAPLEEVPPEDRPRLR